MKHLPGRKQQLGPVEGREAVVPQGRPEEGLLLSDPSSAFPPDCEPPLKKEASLPEGPVLEALLCAETGDKKPELKEEELILDCPVREGEGRDPHPPGPQDEGRIWTISLLSHPPASGLSVCRPFS